MSDDNSSLRNTSDEGALPTPEEGQSRRTVLKAAVIGSAAVAAVAGAGTAGLALAGKNPLNRIFTVTQFSPGDPCAICTTGTNPSHFEDETSFNGQQSIFLWIRFLDVPGGTYTIDVSPTIQPSTASSCSTSTPFQYQSTHNAVTQWVLDPGNMACHPEALDDLPSGTHTDALPASFNFTGTKDLLVQVHIQNCASATQTYTVTGSLKQDGSVIMSCSNEITIK
jgi:hypothetical protein